MSAVAGRRRGTGGRLPTWVAASAVLLVLFLAWAPRLEAQQPNTTVKQALAGLDMLVSTLAAGGGATDSAAASLTIGAIKAKVIATLTSPATLNRGLLRLEEEPFLNGILKPLNLSFANLQTTDEGGGILGLQYQWNKDVLYDSLGTLGAGYSGFHLTAKADGTATLDASRNPRDFLDSEVTVNTFGVWGGTIPAEAGWFDKLNALGDSLTKYTTVEALEASGAFDEFFGQVWGQLTTQLYLTANVSGSVEADQRFDRTQTVFGGHLGIDVKAWNPDSGLAKLNVFDWPAATLRYLFGTDKRIRPLGSAIPTVVLGLDHVDPGDDPARVAIDETSPFYRFTAEVAYRSPLASMSGGALYLEGWLRHYSQMNPSAAVVGADLDSFTEATVSLVAPNGLYVAYSRGRLPFDEASSRVYQAGFRYNFGGAVPGG